MRIALIVVALVCALIAAAFGFDLVSSNSDPHVLGWLSLSCASFFGASLVP